MSGDVIVGYDGRPRCAWAGAGETALGRYHDQVWGTRTYDDAAMFEALTLGVFEVGLSWSVVFGKRDAFRTAFRGFDVAEIAEMTEQDVARLVADASIIRNRGKIEATIDNARAMMSTPRCHQSSRPPPRPERTCVRSRLSGSLPEDPYRRSLGGQMRVPLSPRPIPGRSDRSPTFSGWIPVAASHPLGHALTARATGCRILGELPVLRAGVVAAPAA